MPRAGVSDSRNSDDVVAKSIQSGGCRQSSDLRYYHRAFQRFSELKKPLSDAWHPHLSEQCGKENDEKKAENHDSNECERHCRGRPGAAGRPSSDGVAPRGPFFPLTLNLS